MHDNGDFVGARVEPVRSGFDPASPGPTQEESALGRELRRRQVQLTHQANAAKQGIVRAVRAKAERLEQDRGGPAQGGVPANHFLDAVTCLAAGCGPSARAVLAAAVPAQRPHDGVCKAAAGPVRVQQRPAKGCVVAATTASVLAWASRLSSCRLSAVRRAVPTSLSNISTPRSVSAAWRSTTNATSVASRRSGAKRSNSRAGRMRASRARMA